MVLFYFIFFLNVTSGVQKDSVLPICLSLLSFSANYQHDGNACELSSISSWTPAVFSIQMLVIILNQLWTKRLIYIYIYLKISLLQNPTPVKNCQNTSSWLLSKVSMLLLQKASFSFISCYAPLANLPAEFQLCNLCFRWQLAK